MRTARSKLSSLPLSRRIDLPQAIAHPIVTATHVWDIGITKFPENMESMLTATQAAMRPMVMAKAWRSKKCEDL